MVTADGPTETVALVRQATATLQIPVVRRPTLLPDQVSNYTLSHSFDITRPSRPHVAFGSGIYVCVGQHLARQEITALLGALVARVAHIEAAGTLQWRAGNAVRTLARLPLRLHAA